MIEEILRRILSRVRERQLAQLPNEKIKVSSVLNDIRMELDTESYGQYNLIPRDKQSACYRFCLGIATTGFGREKGFRGVMRDIIKLWFDCYQKNNETLILTVDWAEETFNNNWLPIIESYVNKGNRVFVVQYTEKSLLLHCPR